MGKSTGVQGWERNRRFEDTSVPPSLSLCVCVCMYVCVYGSRHTGARYQDGKVETETETEMENDCTRTQTRIRNRDKNKKKIKKRAGRMDGWMDGEKPMGRDKDKTRQDKRPGCRFRQSARLATPSPQLITSPHLPSPG